MLENIKSPKDIKNFDDKQLEKLAAEIRKKIISVVSENGGHLGSNLGLVEATLVLHRMFDIPNDKLIFDVGHQCYTHKILTGRYDSFHTLRTGGGISGFTNRFESEYDAFTAGHSGSSISTALGIATAESMRGSGNYTVAIVGDGSFTNGMIYEALNNCNNQPVKLIIILNDNEMSISQNVGSLAEYLSRIRTNKGYFNFKRNFQWILRHIPVLGDATIRFFRHLKNAVKRIFYKQPFFEALGVKYFGPVDGNDIERLQVVLEEAKKSGCCSLIHMKTQKGYGYKFAEDCPENYHSVGAFDPDCGVGEGNKNDFSAEFGRIMCELSEKDTRICAITSAMRDGTGLYDFANKYTDRFFDVGIAEEHEIAFAGGLASCGYIPVCAVYSTFAQRTFDQLIHDVSLQKLHIVLALDRSGIVPCDGETHQGVFDCAFLSEIPFTEIYSPDSFDEMRKAFSLAVSSDKISAVRYPKGKPVEYERDIFTDFDEFSICDKFADGDFKNVIITYGYLTSEVVKTAEKLYEQGIKTRIVKLFKVHPISDYFNKLLKVLDGVEKIYFAEEGIKNGGVGQKLCALFSEDTHSYPEMHIKAIDGVYLPHGSLEYVRRFCGFDADSLSKDIKKFINNN